MLDGLSHVVSVREEKNKATLIEQQQQHPAITVIYWESRSYFHSHHLFHWEQFISYTEKKLQLPSNQAARYRVKTFDN